MAQLQIEAFDTYVSPGNKIHAVRTPATTPKPTLLLLHGFPQTHHIWLKFVPLLALNYHLIIPDLPGYGSSQPYQGSFSKSGMASTLVSFMSKLGYEKFGVVGHDRGGRVAHKMCVDFPDVVEKCMVLDIAPTLAMYEGTNQSFATDYWHWFFLIQPFPFPEQLIKNNFFAFANRFLGDAQKLMDPDAVRAYMDQLKNLQVVHAMCEDYRAAATVDLDEARADRDAGRKVKCELRCLWGTKGVVAKSFDALKEWQAVCEDGKVSGDAVESGHYIPEENEQVVVTHILEFFRGQDVSPS